MYIYENMDQTGETSFFFDEKKLITSIDGNDGNYRDEYMDCLFEHFGVQVERTETLNSSQNKEYLKYLKNNGIEIYKEEKEASAESFDFYGLRIPEAFGYQPVTFFIDKKLENSKEFISFITSFVNKNKEKYKHNLLTEISVSYHFKDKAKSLLMAGDGNYLTNRKVMSDRCKVIKINLIDTKKIKTDTDFWNYIQFNDNIESKALVVEKFK